MNPYQLNIEKVFRDRLRNYSPEAPRETWADIQLSLDQGKKRKVYWYRVAATVAVLILSGLLYYFTTADLLKNPLALQNYNKAEYTTEKTQNTNNIPNKIAQSRFSKINKSTEEEKLEGGNSTRELNEENRGKPKRKLVSKIGGISTPTHQNRLAKIGEKKKTEEKEKKNQIYDYAFLNTVPGNNKDLYEKSKKGKLSLSAGLSPTLSYRTVVENPEIASNPEIQQNLPDESSLLAYSSGLGVGYEVFKNFKIRSGLYYSQIGQRLNNVTVSQNSYTLKGTQGYHQVPNSWGNVELMSDKIQPETPEDLNEYGPVTMDVTDEFSLDNTLTQRLEFLKVPLMMELRVLDTKIGLDIIGGFNANFLINNGVYMATQESNQYVGETTGLEKVNYSSVLGFGFNYDISDNTKFFIQPMFDYYLHTVIEENTRVYPYSFNLFTGFSVYFK
jgi:hypothetical protein